MALEYLGHVLPHGEFKPVRRVLEQTKVRTSATESPAEALADRIRAAWESDDGWPRPCAVRAAYRVQGFALRLFAASAESEVGPGGAFGSLALFDESARGHRAECIDDGLALALHRDAFYDVAAGT